MNIYRTVVGNDAPNLTITVERNSTVVNLAGADTVKLIITVERTGEVTNASNQTCAINSPATAGIVTYTPDSTDFPCEGRYLGEIKIHYDDGTDERIEEMLLIVARQVSDV